MELTKFNQLKEMILDKHDTKGKYYKGSLNELIDNHIINHYKTFNSTIIDYIFNYYKQGHFIGNTIIDNKLLFVLSNGEKFYL